VGRQAELRMLKEFHLATGAERRPRLVSIMGQAGIGKSRLVWEFQKYLDGVTELAYWHQGRSPAYGEGITFWALAEMVRARAGIAEGEEPASVRSKLAESVATFVSDEAERRWIEPRLAQLLGLEGSAGDARDRESLFAAWRTFFERIADHATVVLVFEDLQWADGGLLDFIDHLLEWSRDRPIYVISMARPELLDRRPDWGAGRRNLTSLVLEAFSPEEMRQLLDGLVPGLADGLVRAMVERAEGVPLYAVETVRMLLSEGRLERDNGAYRPVGDLSTLSVPPSLQALVAARLDALEAPDRALLQAASVIGKTFSADALPEVSGQSADEVGSRLRTLVRRELLMIEADPRSPERGQYGFVQAVIREVAYGTLARRERRRLHLAAARYFDTLDDEGIAGVLAEHYVAAYRAQPEGAEGQAVGAQARVALRGAADRASALGSYTQAAGYLEQALEITTDAREQAELHSRAANAHLNRGRTDLAVLHFENALEAVRSSDDRPRVLLALVELAFGTSIAGRRSEALSILEAAATDYEDLAGSVEYVRLMAERARENLLLGRSSTALQLIDATIETAERLELRREVLELLVTRGAAPAQVARIHEAIVTLLGAITFARPHEMTVQEFRARVNLSYAAAAEDMELAFRIAREGYERAYQLGNRGQGIYLLGNATDEAIQLGNWDWALEQTSQAITDDPEEDFVARLHNLHVRGLRGESVDAELDELNAPLAAALEGQAITALEDARSDVLMSRGEFAEARRLAVSSYTRGPAPDNPSLIRAGRLACWIGDASGAHVALDRMAEMTGRVVAAAGRSETEAGLAALEGREADAVAGFVEAMRQWRELGARYVLAVAGLGMVTMLGGHHPEARQAADEALEIFKSLAAEPFLRLLDSALVSENRLAPVRPTEPVKPSPTEGVPATN